MHHTGKWRIGAAKRCGVYFARSNCEFPEMIELMRTNDPVVLSFVQSILRDSGIGCFIADQNMSVLDGSIGILPRRILVADEDEQAARRLLEDAGIGNEMRDGKA